MTTKVGFLGGGFIAHYHGKMLHTSGADAAIVAVHDPNEAKADAFAQASGATCVASEDELLDMVDAPRDADVLVTSLQERGAFRKTTLQGNFADDDRTLLALGLDGETLSVDHGYPARIIAPNRPGVLQTKWVSRIEVL